MIPIDLCFALNGPHLSAMLPILMTTMFRHNSMHGVNLHFVDKGCPETIIDWLKNHFDCAVHKCAPAPDCSADGSDTIRDVYETMDFMVHQCGHCEWVFISHFDLEYRGPMLNHYRSMIGPIGQMLPAQIGAHATGLVGYDRRALARCDVSFAHLDDLYIIRETDTGNPLWKIRQRNDHRCTNFDMPVSGWDVGELAELRLLCNKRGVISETETVLQRFRIHNGSGCGRCPGANEEIAQKSKATLERLWLDPIP